jgi:hypothetical protein
MSALCSYAARNLYIYYSWIYNLTCFNQMISQGWLFVLDPKCLAFTGLIWMNADLALHFEITCLLRVQPSGFNTMQFRESLTFQRSLVCCLLLLVSHLSYFLTLKMKAQCSSETSASFWTTWCYNPEGLLFTVTAMITKNPTCSLTALNENLTWRTRRLQWFLFFS